MGIEMDIAVDIDIDKLMEEQRKSMQMDTTLLLWC